MVGGMSSKEQPEKQILFVYEFRIADDKFSHTKREVYVSGVTDYNIITKRVLDDVKKIYLKSHMRTDLLYPETLASTVSHTAKGLSWTIVFPQRLNADDCFEFCMRVLETAVNDRKIMTENIAINFQKLRKTS